MSTDRGVPVHFLIPGMRETGAKYGCVVNLVLNEVEIAKLGNALRFDACYFEDLALCDDYVGITDSVHVACVSLE
jgi:hypothetical protein